jgi:hypothetical protein
MINPSIHEIKNFSSEEMIEISKKEQDMILGGEDYSLPEPDPTLRYAFDPVFPGPMHRPIK